MRSGASRLLGGCTLAALGACHSAGELPPTAAMDAFPVEAFAETDPVDAGGDAADDIAVWVHPVDPASSVIIGTNKARHQGGLELYDLTGRSVPGGLHGQSLNNVDVRYSFPLAGKRVDLVAASNKTDGTVVVATIDGSRELRSLTATLAGIPVDFGDWMSNRSGVYGLCLYHSSLTGKYHAFVTSKTGFVAQLELVESSTAPGRVSGSVVRSFDVNPDPRWFKDDASYVEGCVADDYHRTLYIAEEDRGIWRYGAEPGDGIERRLVDRTGPPGHLASGGDVEGLAIYQASQSAGYLIASSQGDNAFTVYDREGSNAFVTKFRIVSGLSADGTSDTDGIEVVSFDLGGAYASGVFLAQDDANGPPGSQGNQDFKLVRWEDIARGAAPNLAISTGLSPRGTGD